MEEKKKINQVRFEELRSKGFPKGCLDHCYLDGIIIEKLPEEFQISHSRLSECWIQKFSADSLQIMLKRNASSATAELLFHF